MGYRGQDTLSAVISYGPFLPHLPHRRVVILGTVAFVVFAIVIVYTQGATTTLVCERATEQCVLQESYLGVGVGTTQFEIADVRGPRLSSDREAVYLTIDDEERLIHEAFDATRIHEEVAGFFRDASVPELNTADSPSSELWLVLVFASVLFVWCLAQTFRFPTAVEFVVSAQTVQVAERWLFGVLVLRQVFEFERPVDVRVLVQTAHTSIQGDVPGGVLQLVDSNDRVRALTRQTMPGTEVHRRAASELRAALLRE